MGRGRMTITTAKTSDAFSILAGRSKALDSTLYSFKLATGTYARDVIFTDQLDYDVRSMSVWIPFADGNARDGVGDVTEVSGIILSRHRQNPVSLVDHGKRVDLPFGLCCPWDEEQQRYD